LGCSFSVVLIFLNLKERQLSVHFSSPIDVFIWVTF
jgi:hypothetical protein